MTSGARLSVKDLKVTLRASGDDVVDEVSFDVDGGQVLGLVGESGSGKTTVALALLAYARRGLRIAGGRICVSGEDILDLPEAALSKLRGRRVAYVAQDPSSALNPVLTIGRQLRESLVRHGTPGGLTLDQRLDEMLREVRLEGVRNVLLAYPHQLSGGQQQRVMLAMAFACRPEVIVLDEPTTGLDVTTQRRVLDTVHELCSAYGAAGVYVSHDLAVVAELVQSVAVMYAGRIIEYGSTDEVFLGAKHPYTRSLIDSLPGGDDLRARDSLPGRAPRPGRRPVGCTFADRCAYVTAECKESYPPSADVGGATHYARCYRVAELPTWLTTSRRSNPLAHVSESDQPLLAVDGLSAWYGKTPVLEEVSVRASPGESLAVVGESGSGKTTLARCIVGLHRNWTGSIRYDGTPLGNDLRRRSDSSIQEIQYVFQNPYTAMNPRKTVRQLVEQPLRACVRLSTSERAVRISQALADAAMGDEFLDRYPDQLSGGERQRVAIARALVLSPRLLVCDEITSALDVSVQASIIELLKRLQRSHDLTVVFITHNLPLVETIAHTTAVMTEGRIVEIGPTAEVLTRPTAEYTARLLADAPKMITSTAVA